VLTRIGLGATPRRIGARLAAVASTRVTRDPGDGIVELLEPNARAFGDAGGGDVVVVDDDVFDDEPPRPRWLTVAAVVGVMALLAGGVIAAAPWSGDATPPTTTAAPTTTTGTTTPAIGDVGPPGLVIDPPPAGFELTTAANDVGIVDADAGWGEVWAEPGATRTDGRWFSLTLLPFRSPQTDGDPVDVGGHPGWLSEGIDEVATLQFDLGQTDAARLVMITAHGFSQPALIELAASINIVDDRPQLADDRPAFEYPELLFGLDKVAARTTDRDLLDRDLLVPAPRSATLYHHAGTDGVVLLEEVPAGRRDPALAPLSATRIPSLPDGWGVSPEFDGTGLVLATRLLDGQSARVATWTLDDDTEVVVVSTLDLDDFLLQLHLVRRATADEWADAVRHDTVSLPLDTTDLGFVIGPDRREWSVVSATAGVTRFRNARSFELWATPGATRTSGAWVAVHAPVTPVLTTDPSAVRVAVGDDVGVFTTAADGVSTLRIGSFDEGVDITSFGWSLAEVVALAATYPSGAGQLVDVTSIRPDHEAVVVDQGVSESLVWEVIRREQTTTRLARADGELITVVAEPDDPVVQALLPFVVDAPDRTATAFAAPGTAWQSIVTFTDAGQRVIAYSTLPPDELTVLADRIERADDGVWAALLRLGPMPAVPPTVRMERLTLGDTTSGVAWTVDVDNIAGTTALLGFEITDGTAGSSRSVALTGPVTVAQAGPATLVVFRFLPDDVPAEATSVVMTVEGRQFELPLVVLGGPRPFRVAAVVYSELGGFSWAVRDDAGTNLSPTTRVG
jgi:hypothetical protein